MGIFSDIPEIVELSDRLEMAVRKRFKKVCKMDAEEIAKWLFEEKTPEGICSDIDGAIEKAEDLIHQDANTNITYNFDNWVVAYAELKKDEVDWDTIANGIRERASDIADYESLVPAMAEYAYEAWVTGIRDALKEILKEKCEEYGF